jgi:hypothetical protein
MSIARLYACGSSPRRKQTCDHMPMKHETVDSCRGYCASNEQMSKFQPSVLENCEGNRIWHSELSIPKRYVPVFLVTCDSWANVRYHVRYGYNYGRDGFDHGLGHVDPREWDKIIQ